MIGAELQERLEEVARAEVLLVACDYDGTLAPLVADPAAAAPDVAALASLMRIDGLRDTHGAVISGRSLMTLRRLIAVPTEMTLIGTHGAEFVDLQVDQELAQQVADLATELRQLAVQFPGCEVEVKPVGAAFHYRNAIAGGDSAAYQAQRIGEAMRARSIRGKKVVELVLRDVDKGVAIEQLRDRVGADGVVFVGDDTTDEDVFAVLGDRDLGIKVGPEPSVAQARLAAQDDVSDVLGALEQLRRRLMS